MQNIFSYLVASSYSSVSPLMNIASSCSLNGERVACPQFVGVIASIGLLFPLFAVAIGVLLFAGLWKVFTKAGQPGWAAIIPIYNVLGLLKIIRRPWWWMLLYFVPFVSIVVAFIVMYELSKSFGKGIGFTIGLIVVPIVFYPILGFGNAVYTLPSHT
jgi:hypothetical protein